LVIGVVQLDEIDLIIIIIRGSNGPNRKKMTLATETSESLLLVFNIPGQIGTLAGFMHLAAPTDTVAIQLGDNQVLRRFGGRIII